VLRNPLQIYQVSSVVSCHFGVQVKVFFDGIRFDQHKKLLQSEGQPHIAVGTPGRILALVNVPTRVATRRPKAESCISSMTPIQPAMFATLKPRSRSA
jgi:hypothetical protein